MHDIIYTISYLHTFRIQVHAFTFPQITPKVFIISQEFFSHEIYFM